MGKQRSPVQVSDKFLNKLKELQRMVRMKTGDEKSLRELTDKIASSPAFQDIEKTILQSDINIDIRFDRRRL